jgi:hypothetical protein
MCTALVVVVLAVSQLTFARANLEAPTLEWSKTYGAISALSIIQTTDGGFAFVATNATQYVHGYTDYKIILVKITSSGELEWAKNIGPYNPLVTAITQTSDLGFILSSGYWMVKTDAQGNIVWNATFSFLSGAWGTQTQDGNYLIIGTANTQVAYKSDAVLLKYSENSTLIWKKDFIANVDTIGATVNEAKDGNYVLGGGIGMAFWCAKINQNGGLIWNHTYYHGDTTVSPPTIQSIAQTPDNGYILAGSDGANGWLIKIDSDGNEQWHQTYEFGRYVFKSIPKDGFVVFADSNILKTDTSGDLQWSLSYNDTVKSATSAYSNADITANSGIIANDGGYVVAGVINDRGVNSIWIAKFV